MSMMLGLRVTGLGDDLMVYVKSFVTGQEPEDAGMSEPSARDAAADSSLTDAADPEAGTDSGGDAIVDASLDAVGPVFGAADTDWHARPVDADCGDDGVCRWVPLIVPLLGVAPESELECLPVTLRVNVDNGAMYCTTTVSGVLTRELTANSCTDCVSRSLTRASGLLRTRAITAVLHSGDRHETFGPLGRAYRRGGGELQRR